MSKFEGLGIEELGAPRAGLLITFRGCVPDAHDEPSGEYIEVELVVPPLNFNMIKRLQAEQAARGAEITQEQMLDDVVTTIARALQRVALGVHARHQRVAVLEQQQAVEAVKEWKFKPSTGPDGKPEAVRQAVEITFHH